MVLSLKAGRRIAAGALVLVLAAAASVAAVGLRDRTVPADAIVVLGNTVASDGTPSARLRGRLDCALDAFRRKLAPVLIVSGGTGKEGFDEAAVMADYLVARGVPRSAVVVDSAGVDTAATARNAALIGRERGIGSVIVATQYFHVLRSTLALERAGLKVHGNVHARYFEARDLYSLARELPALAAYVLGMRDLAPPAPNGR